MGNDEDVDFVSQLSGGTRQSIGLPRYALGPGGCRADIDRKRGFVGPLRRLGYRDRMRLPVPGPRDVWNVLERGADSVEQLLAAVPRVVALLDEAETMLTQVSRVIGQIEETQAGAQAVVRRTDEVVDETEKLLARTTPLIDRLTPLLDRMEPSLIALQPTLERLAETTDPREVDALVAMIDLLPDIAAKMETHVIPVMDSLSSVSPDLHDLLDVSRELNEMLATVPGLGRMKKRIDEEQALEGRG